MQLDKKLSRQLEEWHVKHLTLLQDLREAFVGKTAKIICPKYNGQICGRSRPKLKDRLVLITDVYFGCGKHPLFQTELYTLKENGYSYLQDPLKIEQFELVDE